MLRFETYRIVFNDLPLDMNNQSSQKNGVCNLLAITLGRIFTWVSSRCLTLELCGNKILYSAQEKRRVGKNHCARVGGCSGYIIHLPPALQGLDSCHRRR